MSRAYRPGFAQELTRITYSFIYLFIIPLSILHWLVARILQKPGAGTRWKNRLGLGFNQAQKGGVLVHCVSVGEVVAASVVIKKLQRLHPTLPIYITTTTITGADRVKQIFADTVEHFYLPFDLRLFMDSMLSGLAPQKVLITEVELWPNLLHSCWRKSIPSYVINARMTDNSARSYGKLSALFSPMLNKLTLVCAQGERDRRNYLALGADENKVTLTNNIKFDQPANVDDEVNRQTAGLNLQDRKLIVAGSTHEGEEALFLQAYLELKPDFNDVLLILVPRHPQRFAKVYQQCKAHNVQTVKMSQGTSISNQTDVLLVDAMGMLTGFYAIADITFVGGSITDRGGHNALEPAAFAKPILMGPHIYNNPVICQTLEDAGALITVEDLPQVLEQCRQWLGTPSTGIEAGKAGVEVLQKNQGAVNSTLKAMGY